MVSVSPSGPINGQLSEAAVLPRRSKLTLAKILACLAVFGRVIVAPIMLVAVFLQTKYLTSGGMFIGPTDRFFAFSPMDAVMVGGCSNCQVGCLNALLQMAQFGSQALMSKPTFENLYTRSDWDASILKSEALALATTMESDANTMVLAVVNALQLSVAPQAFQEVTEAVEMDVNCPSDWVLEAHLRLFRFPAAAKSSEFSSISAADFTIFPEQTHCRPEVDNSGLVASRLALATDGIDLLATVPDVLKLFPYGFTSSLPPVSRAIEASETSTRILQPLFHGYYGGCRVREVNATGVYTEAECSISTHWVNYGLMLQSPDDLPVCSTDDVCVHNYYNSLWEFVTEVDASAPDRLSMVLNVFRSRYADRVQLNVLPGLVVLQILVMGILSLYQVMAHQRSVLLTQIWAYRCQNGRMQVLYLAQITYHLAASSDLYYLGLATGTLTPEALTNLALCFFGFSYSFVNLLKARSGEQQLARHFRLTWETMQTLITVCTTLGLYTARHRSLSAILTTNGELLRKTTARGAAMCNLSDSCIVFKHNLVVVALVASLALASVASFVSLLAQKHAPNRRKTSLDLRSVVPQEAKPFDRPEARAPGSQQQANALKGPSVECLPMERKPPVLTSFERHCLGSPFARLFVDCHDLAYVRYKGRRCSTVEAVLLTGFLFYGEHVYQAQDVVLLLLARVLPRKFTRTFNVLFVRWELDAKTGRVTHPQGCTWYSASGDAFRLAEARPIA
ncbi:hypothetical protein BBJ28_00005585 [Nothophytophthora sp. Chile5]|nr:hypothetical protein BBJ28_00005585 [Nothophytophthora sp. Chile5]